MLAIFITILKYGKPIACGKLKKLFVCKLLVKWCRENKVELS